jgi:aryl-alcohol dehydrogenase-like predicted oxidoreductase
MSVPFVSNQPQYNMLWRVIEAEVVPASRELGIGQIVWSPIAQGVLSGKYRPGVAPPDDSRAGHEEAGQLLRGRMNDDVLARVQRLKPVADQAGLSLAQLAIAWVLANPAVSSAIIGASRPEQVSENAKAAGQRLSADLMEQIDEALEPVVTRDPRQTKSPPNRDFG